jgi:hypothetical protein
MVVVSRSQGRTFVSGSAQRLLQTSQDLEKCTVSFPPSAMCGAFQGSVSQHLISPSRASRPTLPVSLCDAVYSITPFSRPCRCLQSLVSGFHVEREPCYTTTAHGYIHAHKSVAGTRAICADRALAAHRWVSQLPTSPVVTLAIVAVACLDTFTDTTTESPWHALNMSRSRAPFSITVHITLLSIVTFCSYPAPRLNLIQADSKSVHRKLSRTSQENVSGGLNIPHYNLMARAIYTAPCVLEVRRTTCNSRCCYAVETLQHCTHALAITLPAQ